MNKRRLFWGGLLVLFSVLFFVALSAGFVDTLFDYRTFSGINGGEIRRFDDKPRGNSCFCLVSFPKKRQFFADESFQL